MFKHISHNCKCKLNSATCSSNQKWNNKACQCECKYYKCEKDYSWNRSICICENNKYLKNVVDTSATKFDEIVRVMNHLSTKKTNPMATNVTSTASTNCRTKK